MKLVARTWFRQNVSNHLMPFDVLERDSPPSAPMEQSLASGKRPRPPSEAEARCVRLASS